MKECACCGKSKDLSEFHMRSASPDGLQYRCKECQIQFASDWEADNPHLQKKYVYKWMGANRDVVNEGARKRYHQDPTKARERSKKSYYKNLEKNRAAKRERSKRDYHKDIEKSRKYHLDRYHKRRHKLENEKPPEISPQGP